MQHDARHGRSRLILGALCATTVATSWACSGGGGDRSAGESAAAAAAAPPTAAAQPARPRAKDADHEFLRQMIDHHQGLIEMAGEAREKAPSDPAKADARRLHAAQRDAQARMIAFTDTIYGEQVTPTVTPPHQLQLDSLRNTPADEYERRFRALVVAHHREGVQMIDAYLPRATRPDLRQMTQEMRAAHVKELAELERQAK